MNEIMIIYIILCGLFISVVIAVLSAMHGMDKQHSDFWNKEFDPIEVIN